MISSDGTQGDGESDKVPHTGDESNVAIWFVLLFVSSLGIFEITLYDRKRRIK